MTNPSLNNLESDMVPEQPPEDNWEFEMMVSIINTSLRVLNARLTLLLALVGGICIWMLAALDPQNLRLWAAAGYSVGILLPMILFTGKRS